MLWAQWTLLVLTIMAMTLTLSRLGQPKKVEKYGGSDVLGHVISMTLMYMAGTFSGIIPAFWN